MNTLNNVELICNSYNLSMRILIDGKEISQYSPIRQYQDEPIFIWCDRIFDHIYEECGRSPYTLYFSGREEDHMILSVLAGKKDFCTYRYRRFENKKGFQERMKELSLYIKSEPSIRCSKRVFGAEFRISKKYAGFRDALLHLNVENAYCRLICSAEDLNGNSGGDAENLFVIADDPDFEEIDQKSTNRFVFAIKPGTVTAFEGRQGRCYVFSARTEELIGVIFNCLKYASLLLAFTSCVRELREENSRSDALMGVLDSVCSVEEKVNVCIESTEIEKGKSVDFSVRSSKGQDISQKIRVKYSHDGIVSCNGIKLTGIKNGKTKIFLYREGEVYPFYSRELQVIERNRIREIDILSSDLTIGIGDRYPLEMTYLPTDADNIQKISWVSDHPEVLRVDRKGLLTALAEGDCRVYCSAENISDCVQVRVRPYMREITVDVKEITLQIGESYDMQISISPANCIDGSIMIESSSLQIVNARGNRITAVSEGTAVITIRNEKNTVKTQVNVTVNRARRLAGGKKKGFFSKLLGG